MRIITKRTIIEFYEDNPLSADSLSRWTEIVSNADWNNFSDVKKDFNSVDAIGNELYVFNLKGNHYRIIVRIFFNIKRVYIRFVGTHKQYDEVNINNL